ncbi:MAG TPA: tetratricopeptide repeat protein, partial [Candidatus Solibacter sp.]|nr:tetratricopeptide repeat protein [Candidatus Solibacter sp.]
MPGRAERLAILRFENMSGDLSAAWQGRALSDVLTKQLDGIPAAKLHSFDRLLGPRPISAPGISTEAAEALAAGATRVGYGEFTVRNGKLETRLTLEDLRTYKMVKVVEAVVPAGDVLGAAAPLARQISATVKPYDTHNPEALHHYTEALESQASERTERELDQAIAADPDFPAPYTPLAQSRLQRQDRTGAIAILEQGIARTGIAEAQRARFESEIAQVRGDTRARATALAKLSKLEPKDLDVWRALAQTSMAYHDYPQARNAYDKASALAPEDADLLNQLGYAATQSGDLDAGVAALKRYRTMRPKDANALDSLGDVHLIAGKLSQAESYYLEAYKLDPAFLTGGDLLKAAMARLLAGDVAAADKNANAYFTARQQARDPLVEYRRAH